MGADNGHTSEDAARRGTTPRVMPSRSSSSSSPRRPKRTTASSEPLFELRRSSIQGTGAFALREIRKGKRLIEYTGRHLTQEEADERYDDEATGRHHTFLFCLDNKTVIDASEGGNDSRFFNHSCEPNCRAFIEGKRIFLYTERHIWPGEELVYDYSFARTPDMTEEDERRYVCRCGSPFCRGTILVPPRKPRRAARKGRGVKAGKRTRAEKQKRGAR